MNKITFSQAIEGYALYFHARHLSQNTFNDYFNTFNKFQDFLGDDPPIDRITSKDIEAFLAAQDHLANKTLLNYHTGLSALWTWCVKEEMVGDHIVQKVDRPKPEQPEVQPYSEQDVRTLLKALKKSKIYLRPGMKESTNTLQTANRNRAIILLLLDTGVRSSELCQLLIHHTDMKNREIIVMGKGNKERILPFCARTGQAIWRYLASRRDDSVDDFLFVTEAQNPFDRHYLRRMLSRIGKRAGVKRVGVHRFRHTFAINYLRNGGDPFSLQRLLGHSTMEMVKRYLNIVQADLTKNHKLASPVDNWRL